VEIVAEAVEVIGAHSRLLAPTSLHVSSGELLVVSGPPNAGHTALALALSGRLQPGRGSVRLDGRADPRALRRAVAVVDAPEITEPEPSVPVRTVVAEGLSMAGRSARRAAVRSWLAEHGLAEHASTRMENLPAAERTRLLVDLAAAAEPVEVLVLDTPDRHGGAEQDWYELARRESDRGRAVVLLCSEHSADRLGLARVRIGNAEPGAAAAEAPAGGERAAPEGGEDGSAAGSPAPGEDDAHPASESTEDTRDLRPAEPPTSDEHGGRHTAHPESTARAGEGAR